MKRGISIRFDPDQRARLRALAERNGMSFAQLVRIAVTEWFEFRRQNNGKPPKLKGEL